MKFLKKFTNRSIKKNNSPKKFLGLLVRCKDEYFIEEFCNHYLNQGVDEIIIVDDNSADKSIYENLTNNQRVRILMEEDIIQKEFIASLYPKIRNHFEWLIYVDTDEFITTKKHNQKTIRETLQSTFKNVDCVKIPWVMMSCNSIDKNPKEILNTNIFRWDHDKKHPSEIHKFRCRYDKIEVKCIFKPAYFDSIFDHNPLEPNIKNPKIVDSINNETSSLDPFHANLREHDISSGYLLCYHYRIISRENNHNKLKNNFWYIKNGYTENDLISSDHPDIIDRHLVNKTFNKFAFIHVGKCGGTLLKMSLEKMETIHMRKPNIASNTGYILWIRNPINRFVSAFNHSLSIIRYDTEGKDFDDLYNDKKCPYYRLRNKIISKFETGCPFSEWVSGESYASLITDFSTANNLAEALSSDDSNLRKKAHELMSNTEVEHIAKGLGWYTNNGELIKQHHCNLFFVGKQETMREDLQELYQKLDITAMPVEHRVREQSHIHDKHLSPLAIQNIKSFYKETDYKSLQALCDYGFITIEVLEEYNTYKT